LRFFKTAASNSIIYVNPYWNLSLCKHCDFIRSKFFLRRFFLILSFCKVMYLRSSQLLNSILLSFDFIKWCVQ
jgi:hypothetical protein